MTGTQAGAVLRATESGPTNERGRQGGLLLLLGMKRRWWGHFFTGALERNLHCRLTFTLDVRGGGVGRSP
jgi:hypothetical protein